MTVNDVFMWLVVVALLLVIIRLLVAIESGLQGHVSASYVQPVLPRLFKRGDKKVHRSDEPELVDLDKVDPEERARAMDDFLGREQ